MKSIVQKFAKLVILYCIFFNSLSLLAQVPEKMSYQAVIRNSNDELVNSSSVGMRISILSGSVSGQSVYSETHSLIMRIKG